GALPRGRACGPLLQHREQTLHLSAVALNFRRELGTLSDRHADAVDDDIGDFVRSVLRRQTPIDLDGQHRRAVPACPWPAAVRDIDLARNDRPLGIEPAAGHPRGVPALGILRQPGAIRLYDVLLEQRQELLLL